MGRAIAGSAIDNGESSINPPTEACKDSNEQCVPLPLGLILKEDIRPRSSIPRMPNHTPGLGMLGTCSKYWSLSSAGPGRTAVSMVRESAIETTPMVMARGE